MSLFHGLSAFPITPCDANGNVDKDAMGTLVARLNAADVNAIGLLGSTGTYAYLNRRQRHSAIKAAKGAANGTKLIVGIGALRTDDVIDYATDAADGGADGLLLAPVSYTPLTQDEVFAHFKAIAETTDLPICIYNNPGTTHFTFSKSLLQRLADLPTVTAVKMPLPANGSIYDDLKQLRAALPDGFAIGYSGDWGCAEALGVGADAWFSVLGGIMPKTCMALTAAAKTGDLRLNSALLPLWALFQDHGSLRVVYAMANVLGITQAQPPQPILPLDAAAQKRLAEVMEMFGDEG